MKIQFLIIMLVLSANIATAGKETKVAKSLPSALEFEIADHDLAIEVLGGLLIQKGLLSPWLEKMWDAQKELDNLDKKNNFGIRQYAMSMMEKRNKQCKEMEAAKNAPAKDPLEREVDTLNAQKKALIEEILNKKNEDISALVTLNAKIDSSMKKWMSQASKDFEKEQKKPEGSPEYKALVQKLKAYADIVFAGAATDMKLSEPVIQVFASPQAKQSLDTLEKYNDMRGCTPRLNIFTRESNNIYGDTIKGLASFYSLDQMMKKRPARIN